MATRLDKLREKHEQLQHRIRQEEAKMRTRERKLDTRRKVLLGALLNTMMDENPSLRTDVERRLETFLTRAIDRDAFGLAGGTFSDADDTETVEVRDDEGGHHVLASALKRQEQASA
jgi:hypothetical protein